ncbi:MAG: hypothetical protein JW395_2794 [Nitrospira sp.]|nr:hypothetical protein [Nitrospira sp.]
METFLIIVVLFVILWYALHRSGNPAFWRVVRRNPELAMAWFESEDCWVIVRQGESSPALREYTVGFAVLNPQTGRMVKVHCLADRIDDSQARFLASLSSKAGCGGNKGGHSEFSQATARGLQR